MSETPSTDDRAVVVDRHPDPRNKWAGKLTTGAAAVGALLVLVYTLAFGEWGRASERRVMPASLMPPTPNVETLEQLRRRAEALPDPIKVSSTTETLGKIAGGYKNIGVLDGDVDVAQSSRPVDPGVDDRKRKEYESLFAGNVAWSKGQGQERSRRAVTPQSDDDGSSSSLPSTDEVVASVVKAMTAQEAPGVVQKEPVASPSAAPVNAPAASVAKPEAGLHTVFEGTWLSGVLTNRLNGSAVGPVNVLMSEPLYAADGILVAPAGSRLLGAASQDKDFGQSRLAVSFHRLLLPNGQSRSLDQFKGLSQVGEVGLKDKVNNHYLSTFGAAALIGLIQGLSQYIGSGGARGDGDDVYVVTGSVTDSASQQTAQVMSRFLNRPPEIEIREGVRVRAYVSSDLTFPPYRGGR